VKLEFKINVDSMREKGTYYGI